MRGRLRLAGGQAFVDASWGLLASLGNVLPAARPERHGVERIVGVPYRDGGAPEHLLDVYRPRRRNGRLPVVLYVHGGGFRILSKDSHWIFGLAFARRGYVVFNISYRLAPAHPYPAAVEDACAAALWVQRNAPAWGGDPGRIVFAGESAGANIVTSLAVCSSYQRPEPFARAVWDAGLRPRAVLPACGLLQVSDVERLVERKRLPWFLADRLYEVEDSYLPPRSRGGPGGHDLADPLVVIERGPPDRALPPFFACVGTADPLLDDTRRLEAALGRLGVPCEARYYPGEVHAFHAIVWRPAARDCWRAIYRFLDAHVPATPVAYGADGTRPPART